MFCVWSSFSAASILGLHQLHDPIHVYQKVAARCKTRLHILWLQGYALIEYGTKQEAQAAIDDLDGKELLTQAISVTWAFSSGPLRKARR